jgi:hypothetical protein
MPGADTAHPLQPVIGGAVERQHVQPAFDQRDERQEVLAVQPVLVQFRRRAVGCGHHGNAMVHDQRGEQPAHDHGVGTVVHDHLVEAQHARFLPDRGGDRQDRIAAFLLALLTQARVHVEHEFVEVRAALGGDGKVVVEQVHQHGLAAPHAAPHVQSARLVLRLAAQQLAEKAGRGAGVSSSCWSRSSLAAAAACSGSGRSSPAATSSA